MYTLILIFAIKTQFNTSVDIKQVTGYNSAIECTNSAERIVSILKRTDSDIRVEYFCETKGK